MRRDSMKRMRLRSAGGVLLALAAAACDGPNQFSTPLPTGNGSDVQAPVVDIRVPRSDSITAKPLGDSIEIHAYIDDDLGVDSVGFFGIERRGDPEFGTDTVLVRYLPKTVVLNQARDTVIRRFLEAAPDQTRDTAQVFVVAWDGNGNSTADSVRVVMGGPDVRLTNLEDGQSVQAGLTLSLQLRAYDPSGLTRVEFDLSGLVEQSLVQVVDPPRDSVRFNTTVPIPVGGTGALDVTAVARNQAGLQGIDGPVHLTVVSGAGGDTEAPTPRLAAAAEDLLELQDSVLVVVTGADD
ncbi:MAG TPA: hypothetical protein VE173_06015, partial [Longimicrobiales bacterium]|nr:hypothetical protein [Longimicrobiales bacterium]